MVTVARGRDLSRFDRHRGDALAAMAMARHPALWRHAGSVLQGHDGPQSDARSLRQLAGAPGGVLHRQAPGPTPEWLGVPNAQLEAAHRQRVARHRAERSQNASGALDGAHASPAAGRCPFWRSPADGSGRRSPAPRSPPSAPRTRAVDFFDSGDRRGGQLGAGAQCRGCLVTHAGERDLQLALVGRPGGDARSHHFELRVLGHRLTLPPASRPGPGRGPGAPTGVQPRIS